MKKIANRKYKEFASGLMCSPVNRQLMVSNKAFELDNLISNSKSYFNGQSEYINNMGSYTDDITIFNGNLMTSNDINNNVIGVSSKFQLESPSIDHPDGVDAYWVINSDTSFNIMNEYNDIIAQSGENNYSRYTVTILAVIEVDNYLIVILNMGKGYVYNFKFDKLSHEITSSGLSISLHTIGFRVFDYDPESHILFYSISNNASDLHNIKNIKYVYTNVLDSISNSNIFAIRTDNSEGLANINNYTQNNVMVYDIITIHKENNLIYNLQFRISTDEYDNEYEFVVIKHDIINQTYTTTPVNLDLGILTELEFKDILNNIHFLNNELYGFTTPTIHDDLYLDDMIQIMTKAQGNISNSIELRFMQFRYNFNPNNPADVTLKLYGTQLVDCGAQSNTSNSLYWRPLFLNDEKTHLLRKDYFNDVTCNDYVEMRFDHWNGWYNTKKYNLGANISVDYKNKLIYDFMHSGNVYNYDTYHSAQKFIHIKGFENIDYNGTETSFDLEITSGYIDKLVETVVTLQIKSSNAVFDNNTAEGISSIEVTTSADKNTPTVIQVRITDYGNVQIDSSALTYDEYVNLKNSSII